VPYEAESNRIHSSKLPELLAFSSAIDPLYRACKDNIGSSEPIVFLLTSFDHESGKDPDGFNDQKIIEEWLKANSTWPNTAHQLLRLKWSRR
jgi:hypothetical protein